PSRFDAVVVLALDEKWTLPEDSDARISQDGLLGGSYIAISPGAADETEFPIAKDGTGEIIYARGSVDLLTLVGSLASGTSE
ncbi:MAG: MlaD family protein, partial [Pseudomonadota bacterium]